MPRQPVYVKPNKAVKHVMNLMLAVADSHKLDNPVECGKVIRKCESSKCFAANDMSEPDTDHIYAKFPSLLWYGCLDCGRQTYFDAEKVGCDPDEFYGLPYELQKLAVTDYEAFRVALLRRHREARRGEK